MYQITKQKYLLPPELEALKAMLSRDMSRNGLMFKAYLKTGARAEELLATTKADISADSIYIHGLKHSYDREIPVDPKFAADLISLAPNGGRIFDISYSRLVQLWAFYRPVEKSVKSLRHTFAVELYKKTRDIRLVQMALGHKNINNTLVYAALVDGQEKLREALR